MSRRDSTQRLSLRGHLGYWFTKILDFEALVGWKHVGNDQKREDSSGEKLFKVG